jgi:hypothetical protein
VASINDIVQGGENVIACVKRGVLLWRIYYGDGSHVCSEDTDWEDAPSDNVQVVLAFRLSPRGDRLWCDLDTGDDEYRLEGHKQVKRGAWCDDYQRIWLDAYNEKNRMFAKPIAEVLDGR